VLQEFLINAKASDKQQATLIKACNKLGEVPSLKKLNEMLNSDTKDRELLSDELHGQR